MKNMYILSGCNGAGKTTAAYFILPELKCKEFVNADEIARGLSPFQPEKMTYQAGKLMSHRIQSLIEEGEDFAVETTLAAMTYKPKIEEARSKGYIITLIYFWLTNSDLAKQRVKLRVEEGGHDVPESVIERRYLSGIKNLFDEFINICDNIMLFDNSGQSPILVMDKLKGKKEYIYNYHIYNAIRNSYVR